MNLFELKTGDVIYLKDKEGYKNSIFKFGGTYKYKKGKVTGFINSIWKIIRLKIELEAENGELFYIYEHDLEYWEKV